MRRRPLPPVREEVPPRTWRTICDKNWVVYSLVACVGALCYANSLYGEFVHDDIPAIVTNSDVIGHNNLMDLFVNDFWGTPMWDPASHKSYRPLSTLSFRINHFLFGLEPWWWHACNAALHAACCALVARTAAKVARLQRPFAALAALLFAVHPVHTEAVAGVVGRADVIACLFFLSSLLLYHGSNGKYKVWRSILTAALSMLAKETGLTVMMFNFALDLHRGWQYFLKSSTATKWRCKYEGLTARLLKVMVSAAVLVAFRLAMLHGSLPSFSDQDNPVAFHPSMFARFLTFSYLAAFNWWLVLCPSTLSHDWQMGSVPIVTSILDPRNMLTCVAFIALLVFLYICLVDLECHRRTPAVVGFLLLVLPYLPASNLLFTVGFVVAERVLYIPSIGSVILTVYGIQLLWQRRRYQRWLVFGVGVLVASGVAKTYVRNNDWKCKETLLRADLAILPHNAKLHYNYGNYLKDIDQQDKAIKHYEEALSLWPSYASAHNNLGTLLMAPQAEYHFMQALKYNQYHVNAHFNLGKLYRRNNQISEAVVMLQRCISLSPRFTQAYLELLLLTPNEDKRGILQRLLHLEPWNWEHYLLYGNWINNNGWKSPAVEFYLKSMRLSFRNDPRSGTRGDLVSLSATCLALRQLGQHSRILQLVTRWHTHLGGPRNAAARNLHLHAWRLQLDLAARAQIYTNRQSEPVTSTCVHHSQLELSVDTSKSIKTMPIIDINQSQASILEADRSSCEKQKKNLEIINERKVSISTPHKPIHNKSDVGQKVCPLQNDDTKNKDAYAQFDIDRLIKTC